MKMCGSYWCGFSHTTQLDIEFLSAQDSVSHKEQWFSIQQVPLTYVLILRALNCL